MKLLGTLTALVLLPWLGDVARRPRPGKMALRPPWPLCRTATERVQDYASRSKSDRHHQRLRLGLAAIFLAILRRSTSSRPCPRPTRPSRSTSQPWPTAAAKAATIARRLVVIAQAHKGGRPALADHLIARSARARRRGGRTIGTAPGRQSPRRGRRLERRCWRNCPTRASGLRDRARASFSGFAVAFRRFRNAGFSLDVRRSRVLVRGA